MARSENKKTRNILETLSLGLLATWLTNFYLSHEACANSLSPQITISLEKLKTAGIQPEKIRTSTFLKMPTIHASMRVNESDESSPLTLSRVQFNADNHPGIWLRSQCHLRTRAFNFEECRGSVCTPAYPLPAQKKNPHERSFSGEFGTYTLSTFNFGKQALSGGLLDSRLCNSSWPAWAVSARARSKNTSLSFPNSLLILQSSNQIAFINAIHGTLWNTIRWPEDQGILSHARISEDGRLLLQDHYGNALFLNFSDGSFVSLRGGSVSSSTHGLNALFATAPEQYTTEAPVDLPSQSFFTLTGVWSANGFLTWDDLRSHAFSKNNPTWRTYPDAAHLLSALWSEHSGLEKSYVLVSRNGKIDLLSSLDAGKTFDLVKSFGSSNEVKEADRLFIHDEFITRISSQGEIQVRIFDQFFSENNLQNLTRVIQGGTEILTYQQLDERNCSIVLYQPRSSKTGWQQSHILPKAPCSTGLGRSSTAASLVEVTSKSLNIYVSE